MDSLEISPILKALSIRHQLIKVNDSGASVLSLFDDSFFTQSDFDIIDGRTRNLITAGLKKRGFTLKGSRFFSSPNGQNYQFAKPSHTLGCNPADKVDEVLKKDCITFTTPTQTLLLLVEHNNPLTRDSAFLERFLLEQPVNIKKLVQWVYHDNFKDRLPFSENQLNIWNELGAKKAQGKK